MGSHTISRDGPFIFLAHASVPIRTYPYPSVPVPITNHRMSYSSYPSYQSYCVSVSVGRPCARQLCRKLA